MSAYVLLGTLFETRGQWQQAEDLYQKALQIQPDYPVAANNLAYLMLDHDGNINVAFRLRKQHGGACPMFPTRPTLWAGPTIIRELTLQPLILCRRP